MITSLLQMAKLCNNESILPIITLAVSIIMPLLPIITIITYYYVFETGQLEDALDIYINPWISIQGSHSQMWSNGQNAGNISNPGKENSATERKSQQR